MRSVLDCFLKELQAKTRKLVSYKKWFQNLYAKTKYFYNYKFYLSHLSGFCCALILYFES